jgi:hypothetical protein
MDTLSLLEAATRRRNGAAPFDWFAGFEDLLPYLLIGAGILIVWAVVYNLVTRSRAQERADVAAGLQEAAQNYFQQLAAKGSLTIIDVNIMLQRGEGGILQERSNLLETRAYRVYGGGGTRIRGIYVGGGASESHQRWRDIDSGTLVLTNKRLVFDGGSENRAVKLTDILSIECWADAIEVGTSRRQKSQVYTVANPYIWKRMIEMLAGGQIQMDEEEMERGKIAQIQGSSLVKKD